MLSQSRWNAPIFRGRNHKKSANMAKKNYKIRARIVFTGEVTVRAHSRQEAEAAVGKGIAALLGRVEVQPEAEDFITDWDFPTHGEVIVKRSGEEAQA